MSKVEVLTFILAGLTGVMGFIFTYKYMLFISGPFVGGIVGFFAGLIAFMLISFVVMAIGRYVEGRCNV